MLKERLSKERVLIPAVALFGAAISIALGISIAGKAPPPPIPFELFKFSLTVMIGGIFGYLIRSIELAKQRRDVQVRELRSLHTRFLAAYNGVKKARRNLRVRSVMDAGVVRLARSAFDNCMDELNDAQLDFESMKREAELAKKGIYYSDQLFKNLKIMEKYVGDLISDCEELDYDEKVIIISGASGKNTDILHFFLRKEQVSGIYELNSDDPDRFKLEFTDVKNEVNRLIRDEIDRIATGGPPARSSTHDAVELGKTNHIGYTPARNGCGSG